MIHSLCLPSWMKCYWSESSLKSFFSLRELREREGRSPGGSHVLKSTLRCVFIPLSVCDVFAWYHGVSWSQCANVDMEVLALPLQLSPVAAPASALLSAGSSRLRSFVLSWMMHWSQSSGNSSMRKPRQMMKTAMRRTVLK